MVPTLTGYVAVDTIEQHSQISHGVNHLFNHGRSELNWPPLFIRCDYLSLITIHDMLHDRSCFGFSMYFTFFPHVPDVILFLYIVNSLTLTPIGIPFC